MHEHAILRSLMKEITRIAAAEGARRVTAVHVHLGALSHLTEEHFREHFAIESRGTPAEGAALSVEVGDHDRHLDVASGTGEPGLTVARIAARRFVRPVTFWRRYQFGRSTDSATCLRAAKWITASTSWPVITSASAAGALASETSREKMGIPGTRAADPVAKSSTMTTLSPLATSRSHR